MDESFRRRLVAAQVGEITEYHVYRALAQRQKDPHNRRTLERIADDERRHYDFWAQHTGVRPAPRMRSVWKFRLLAATMGLTFAIKLMERGEEGAQSNYAGVANVIPEAAAVLRDEQDHERELVAMIDEERLRYVGSVVLGLSDALVELTGALAGLTLALRHSRLIAAIGLITGVAAALSMAASEYLSTKAEAEGADESDRSAAAAQTPSGETAHAPAGVPAADSSLPTARPLPAPVSHRKSAGKSALYTGVAYLLTVAILIAPFLLLGSPLAALALTVGAALLIIFAFAYYVSVARDLPLWRRFGEMAGLSLGVAAVSFAIGYVVRAIFGVDV